MKTWKNKKKKKYQSWCRQRGVESHCKILLSWEKRLLVCHIIEKKKLQEKKRCRSKDISSQRSLITHGILLLFFFPQTWEKKKEKGSNIFFFLLVSLSYFHRARATAQSQECNWTVGIKKNRAKGRHCLLNRIGRGKELSLFFFFFSNSVFDRSISYMPTLLPSFSDKRFALEGDQWQFGKTGIWKKKLPRNLSSEWYNVIFVLENIFWRNYW